MELSKLLCLGDSLTEGYELAKGERWTDQLQAEVNFEVVNCGISGDTTTGMLARCERLLIEYTPSHLLVLGGTNDLWFGLKDEFILSNLHAITRQARHHKAEFVIGVPTPAFNLNELNCVQENYSECIRSFRNSLKRYCTSEGTAFIDFSNHITSDHMLSDGVHPNKVGHEIMKNNALDFFRNDQ